MTTILISQIHDIMIDRTQKLLLTEFRNIFLSTESESCFQPELEYLLDKLPVLKRIVDGIILKYNQSKQSHTPKSWLYGIIMEETVPPYISDYRTKDTRYSIYDHAVEAWWAVSEYAMSLAMISQRFMDSKLEDRSRELFLVAQEMYKSLTWSLSQSQCSSCTFSTSQEGMCRYHAVIEKYDENPDLYLECSIFNRTHISEYSRNRLASGVQKHDDISNILSSDYCPVKENPRRQRDTYINMLERLINQDDYRPFLYALYYQSCNEVDPGTGNIYAEIQRLTDETQTTVQSSWCNIIERALRPTIGLRWMLCYEEQDRDVCHLQKGCPESWFSEGQEIRVEYCPTRFGTIGWRTKCVFRSMWFIELEFYKKQFLGKLIIHIHPPDGTKLYVSSVGRIVGNTIEIDQDVIFQYRSLYISVNEGEMEDE